MRRVLYPKLVIIAVLLVFLATPGLVKAEEKDEFVFGGSFTLSGPAAFLGLFEEAAVRLAVEQFMKGDCIIETDPPVPCEGGGLDIGGKKVKIVWKAYDDQSEAQKAVNNVTRLVEQDEAVAIWGPRMNAALLSSSYILEPREIINICSICSSPAMTVGRNFGHDITDTGVIEKHAMGAFINEPPETLKKYGVDPKIFEGRKRTAIIARNELYCVHGAYGWAETMKKFGNKYQFDLKKDVVYYPFDTIDFAPYVAKIAKRKPDIVLMDVYVIPDMLAIMKEMVKQGLDFQSGKVILLGNDVLALDYFVGEAKKEGMNMSSGYVWGWQEHNPALDNPAALSMIKRYTEIYNTKYAETPVGASSPFDRGTYDAAMWFLKAVQKAGTITDTGKIVNTWRSLKLNGLRGHNQEFFTRPDTGKKTGQLLVTEYIMGIKNDAVYYTGLNYSDSLFYGPWVFGDKLPR